MTTQQRKESQERIVRAQAEAQEIVSTGRCPYCGSALRRNNALTGWWECEQRGDGHFRARPDEVACSFQCFTA